MFRWLRTVYWSKVSSIFDSYDCRFPLPEAQGADQQESNLQRDKCLKHSANRPQDAVSHLVRRNNRSRESHLKHYNNQGLIIRWQWSPLVWMWILWKDQGRNNCQSSHFLPTTTLISGLCKNCRKNSTRNSHRTLCWRREKASPRPQWSRETPWTFRAKEAQKKCQWWETLMHKYRNVHTFHTLFVAVLSGQCRAPHIRLGGNWYIKRKILKVEKFIE